jgi:O-antigen/teichoic acid export membrane protein
MTSVAGILRSHHARSLLSGATWSVLGQMSLALAQWGIVVALARTATPAAVGEFALGMALTAPLFGFSNMCLAQLQATDVHGEHSFGAYAGVRLLTTVAALLILPLLLAASSSTPQELAVAVVFGFARAADGASDVCYGLMQRHGRFRTIGQSMLLRSAICGMAAMVALQVTNTGLGAAVGLALAWSACALLFDLPKAKQLLQQLGRLAEWRMRFGWPFIAGIVRDGVPLSLVMGLNMAAMNIPRYWVARQLGHEQLGYFAAIAYLMIAANMVIAAGSQAVVPRLAEDYVKTPRRYCRLVLYMVAAAVLAGVLCVGIALTAGQQIMAMIYTARYAQFQSTLVWTMAGTAVLILVSVTGVAMTAARRFGVQVWNSAAAAISTALACVVLIGPYGLDGAAIAVLIGLVVKLLGQCFVLATLLPEAWTRRTMVAAESTGP